MKKFLTLLILTGIFLSQEKKIVTESDMGQNIFKGNHFITKNFLLEKTPRRETIFFANSDKIYVVEHKKKELKEMDLTAVLAAQKQQAAMLGELVVTKTDKKKKIKNIETHIYKITNKNSPVSVKGKMYIGYIKELADPKFKFAVDFRMKSNSALKQLKSGDFPIKLIMSIDMGQGQAIDIESRVIKIKDKFSKDDKTYIEKVLKYKKVSKK